MIVSGQSILFNYFISDSFIILQLMSINIFQFLKQGTSVKSHNIQHIKQLQTKLEIHQRVKNQDYDRSGKFREIDSEENDDQELQQQARQKNHRRDEDKRRVIRKLNRIKVKGDNIPNLLNNFTKIIQKYNIKPSIIQSLSELGFQLPTPVQMQVIPCLIQKRNTLATAPTGSGKTIAFGLPLVQNLSHVKNKIQAIILAPFFQLSEQILQEIIFLAKGTDLKIASLNHLTEIQKQKLEKNKKISIDILIATPLNFINTFKDHQELLFDVEYFIMDECDKYFEQSFLQQIKQILSYFKQLNPVFGLFSATIQYPVQQLLKTQLLEDSVRVEIGGKNNVLAKINQRLQYCSNEFGKLLQIRNLINDGKFTPPALIFVQSKERAKQLFYEIRKIFKQTIQAIRKIQYISADKSKTERQELLKKFENGETWVLISTDLIARGVDFKGVNLVINYDFPNSILTYIHRVGRTGRADREGQAITFYTDEDKPQLKSLANLLKVSGCQVPQWIFELKKAQKKELKRLQKKPVFRESISRNPNKHVDPNWKSEIAIIQKRFIKKQKEKTNNQQDQGWNYVEE